MFSCLFVSSATLLDDDSAWGTGTLRQQLLARLDGAIEATSASSHLPALGNAAGALARELHARWDGEVMPLPIYPAFQST